MRAMYSAGGAFAKEIPGAFMSTDDKIVTASLFGPVCRLCWPRNTAAHLAAIAKRDERTAKRWLAGEHEPPIEVALAVFQKIFVRN